MQSLFAYLRTLVLPFGVTTGIRIVLDGVNGVISIYDASNNLVAQVDSTGVVTIDPANSSKIKLEPHIVGAFGARAGILLDPGTLAGAADAGLLYTTTNPGVVLESPTKQGTTNAFIILNGTDFSSFPPTIVLTAAGGNIQLNAPDIQWGNAGQRIAGGIPLGTGGALALPKETSTASTAAAVETKDTNLGDYQFVAISQHRYRIMCHGRLQLSIAGQADLIVRDGGAASPTTASTQVAAASEQIPNTTGGQHVYIGKEKSFTAGTHTVAAFYKQTAGGGNCSFGQAAGETRQLWVEDMGA
jgi:hypothetical protein